jgi:protease IV
MKQFFKFMFASMVGTLLLCIISSFIFFALMISLIAGAQSDKSPIKENSVLVMQLDQPIYDRTSNNPFENFDFGTMKSNTTPGLNDMLDEINYAATDQRIKGIYLELSSINAGMATVEEIRNALLEFKKSGKFIIAYSEAYSQTAYYLATVADKVYINPEGMLDFKGLSAQLFFLKGLMEKIEVQPQIIRHGKYKSAIEPLISDKMSDANKEQTTKYITSLWEQMLKGISETRKIDVAMLNNMADSLYVTDGMSAMDFKMVDGAKYKDEVLDELRTLLGIEKSKKIEMISLVKYNKAIANDKSEYSKDKIAVVYAQGDIVSGDGDDKTIGSEKVSLAIRQARLDSTVKAIVLRVNSPGGSALASEVIWREVVLAAKEKPVVASMGDLAASGGYYISCAATKIIASPNTITGSIGVFGVIPNMEKLFNNKLGITFDGVSTNKHSDYISVFRPMDAYETKVVQNNVEKTYGTFVKHVAEGRKMTEAQVDSIGQGRVWSGADAKNIGLIDDFGGLKDAIALAASLAKVEKYRIVDYPKRKDAITQLVEQLSGEGDVSLMLQKELGTNYTLYQQAKSVTELKGVQARIPYQIIIY